jgi:hypothetical protein
LVVNGHADVAPLEREVIVASPISLFAPLQQALGPTLYEFVSWSDGGAAAHVIIANESVPVISAQYRVACPREVDGDGDVDIADLAILLSNFGQTSGALPGDGDMNDDGDVDLEDLATLLSNFGRTC